MLRIALGEIEAERGWPAIYLDLRKFEERGSLSYRDLAVELQEEVNRAVGRFPWLLEALRHVEGVSVAGNSIRLGWGRENRASLSSVLEALDDGAGRGGGAVIALDEAQELTKLRGGDVLPALAYAYDNLKRVKVVLSGSEMGLLYEFLRVDDPEGPLFGRAMSAVELRPFTKDQAVEFLRRGFEELGIRFNRGEEVYERVRGIPGWLAYFGFSYWETGDPEGSLSRTAEHARQLILREFENFLVVRYQARRRYYAVMRALSGCGRWSEVKRALEAEEGVEISDSELNNYLVQLIKHSWIEKRGELYCPSEPMTGRAFSRAPGNEASL